MTDAYWFWRVSQGGTVVEPFLSRGSVMPGFKDQLSVEDRWAVIAYQHTLSDHKGPHVVAEHPELRPDAVAPGGTAGSATGEMHSRMHGTGTPGASGEKTPTEHGAIGSASQQMTVPPEVKWTQWVTRDQRWQPRGPWNWAVPRELPQLFREFNGIDFRHAHLVETLLRTQDPERVERARLEVLDFIFSSPAVPPDEEQVAPTLVRLVWEIQGTFSWAHLFHRSLYDVFATDKVHDKEAAYRKLRANYLEKPEAITDHRLDHHGKLWSLAESRSFRQGFPKFNTQIWAYHWLQAATYDVQLMGNAARQRDLLAKLIEHYHGYLRKPPVGWQLMPMLPEGAPEFSRRFSEAAAVFDNLHMLHDNIDDVLTRPDLYPTLETKRRAILRILPIYLHRNHVPTDRYAEYHGMAIMEGPGGDHGGMKMMGPCPPSAQDVLEGKPGGKHEGGRATDGDGHEH